jgi:hypothetical protein
MIICHGMIHVQWRISNPDCLGCSPGCSPVKRIGPSPRDSLAPAAPNPVNILPLSYTPSSSCRQPWSRPRPDPRRLEHYRRCSLQRRSLGAQRPDRRTTGALSQAARPAGAQSPTADSSLSSRRPRGDRSPEHGSRRGVHRAAVSP